MMLYILKQIKKNVKCESYIFFKSGHNINFDLKNCLNCLAAYQAVYKAPQNWIETFQALSSVKLYLKIVDAVNPIKLNIP